MATQPQYPMSQQPGPQPGLQYPSNVGSPTSFAPPQMQAPQGAYFPQQSMTPQPTGFGPGSMHQQQMTNASSIANSYSPLLDGNIVRPNPVHAPGSMRASTVSPPLSTPTPAIPSMSPPPGMAGMTSPTKDEGKISVSIDFGKRILQESVSFSLLMQISLRYNLLWCRVRVLAYRGRTSTANSTLARVVRNLPKDPYVSSLRRSR